MLAKSLTPQVATLVVLATIYTSEYIHHKKQTRLCVFESMPTKMVGLVNLNQKVNLTKNHIW